MLFSKPSNPFTQTDDSPGGQEGISQLDSAQGGSSGQRGGGTGGWTRLDTILARGLCPLGEQEEQGGNVFAFTGRHSLAAASRPGAGGVGSAVVRMDLGSCRARAQLANSLSLLALAKDDLSRALLGAVAEVIVREVAGDAVWEEMVAGDQVRYSRRCGQWCRDVEGMFKACPVVYHGSLLRDLLHTIGMALHATMLHWHWLPPQHRVQACARSSAMAHCLRPSCASPCHSPACASASLIRCSSAAPATGTWCASGGCWGTAAAWHTACALTLPQPMHLPFRKHSHMRGPSSLCPPPASAAGHWSWRWTAPPLPWWPP